MARKHRTIPPLTPQDILRFRKKVRVGKPGECWEWTASKSRGYGSFGIPSEVGGFWKTFHAQRVAWTIANGSFPAALCVLHHCDNRSCQNPAHLFLGTIADNNHDKDRKGRGNPARGDRSASRLHPEAYRGERNSQAKLAEQNIRDIRAEYAAGGIGTRVLARKWNMSQSQIWQIVRRKYWTHVI